jgi:hypothetical protein
MKNSIILNINLYSIAIFLGIILISCNAEELSSDSIENLFENDKELFEFLDDDQLIDAISESTNKEIIDSEKLPVTSRSILANDYSAMEINTVLEDPSLGFEVTMNDISETKILFENKAFFAKDGRELISKKYRKNKFKFIFPVSFKMPDESIITVENDEDLKSKLKAWHDANPESEEKGNIVFPIDLDFGDKIITIISEEEMKALREKMARNKKSKLKKNKFKFIFPVSFTMPDESIITVENDEDLKSKLKAWHDANPESEEKGEIVFPVDLDLGDKIVTINSEEEMKALRENLKKKKKTRNGKKK